MRKKSQGTNPSAQKFGELAAVLKLEVLAERLVEPVEVDLVFRDLSDMVWSLLNEGLANDLKDLVLLKRFTRHVEDRRCP